MSFTIQSWKESLKKHLHGWRERMNKSGVKSVYAFISASAIWPIIQAVSGGQLVALTELGKLMAGVGTSLLANKLQGWKSETDAAKQIERDIEKDQDLRAELDELIDKLNALSVAREALDESDREWFEETLQKELGQMGNVRRFEAVLKGSGAIAQGDGAKAVGEGAVFIGGNVEGDVIVKKKL